MAQLYNLKDEYRYHASPRCAKCDHVRIANAVKIRQVPGRLPHYVGLMRCGLVWECPTCSARIKAVRADEVRRAVEWHVNGYGRGAAAMLTLTVRHAMGEDLARIRAGVARAFQLLQAGAPWIRAKKRMGFVGSIRALEVTHGPNGWHPHLHIVLAVRTRLSVTRDEDGKPVTELTDEGAELRAWLSARWRACVAQVLGADNVPDDEHGCNLRPLHKADYIAKLGLELTAPATKKGHGEHRTPLEILADFAAGTWDAEYAQKAGDVDAGAEHKARAAKDIALYQTYADAMKGARQLTWTGGFKLAAGILDKTDEEIAEGEESEAVDVAIIAGRSEWDELRHIKGAKAAILEIAQDHGAAGVFLAIDTLLRRTPLGPARPATPAHRRLSPAEMVIIARLPGGQTVWL